MWVGACKRQSSWPVEYSCLRSKCWVIEKKTGVRPFLRQRERERERELRVNRHTGTSGTGIRLFLVYDAEMQHVRISDWFSPLSFGNERNPKWDKRASRCMLMTKYVSYELQVYVFRLCKYIECIVPCLYWRPFPGAFAKFRKATITIIILSVCQFVSPSAWNLPALNGRSFEGLSRKCNFH